jgi:hypothetical protein
MVWWLNNILVQYWLVEWMVVSLIYCSH